MAGEQPVDFVADGLRLHGMLAIPPRAVSAAVALRVGHELDTVDRLVGVAPPIVLQGLDFLAGSRKPKLFLLGDRDEYCPRAAFDEAAKTLPDPLRIRVLAGADHFLFGFEQDIGDHAARFVSEALATSDDAEAR